MNLTFATWNTLADSTDAASDARLRHQMALLASFSPPAVGLQFSARRVFCSVCEQGRHAADLSATLAGRSAGHLDPAVVLATGVAW
jgi:hypothetical protein